MESFHLPVRVSKVRNEMLVPPVNNFASFVSCQSDKSGSSAIQMELNGNSAINPYSNIESIPTPLRNC
jgi:hypothetical protein